MTLNETIACSFKEVSYQRRIDSILKSSTHHQCVAFALACAKDLDRHYDVTKHKDVYNTRKHCLDLVGKWLLDEKSVSKKEFDDAAYAANAAAYAANAAYAAYAAACAANAAAYAAYAAAYAANAANAAYAAANAAARKQKEKELFYTLINIITPNWNIIRLVN